MELFFRFLLLMMLVPLVLGGIGALVFIVFMLNTPVRRPPVQRPPMRAPARPNPVWSAIGALADEELVNGRARRRRARRRRSRDRAWVIVKLFS